jgi:hypothetical protein
LRREGKDSSDFSRVEISAGERVASIPDRHIKSNKMGTAIDFMLRKSKADWIYGPGSERITLLQLQI